MDIVKAIANCDKVVKIFDKVNNDDIRKAEETLGVTFSDEYKLFLSNFGAAILDDTEIFGLNVSKRLDVVKQNLRLRNLYPFNSDEYCIEDLAIGGLITVQNKAGALYTIDYYGNKKIFMSSLSQYIKSK